MKTFTCVEGLAPITRPPHHLILRGAERHAVDYTYSWMDYLDQTGTVYRRLQEPGYVIHWYIIG